MRIRIITETKPMGRLLYKDEPRRRERPAAAQAPFLLLAGADDEPVELHIVRGID